MKVRLFLITILLSFISFQALSQPPKKIKQPTGWTVQYLNASCIVNTEAFDPDSDPFAIKMGYLAGNQLIFIVSIHNKHWRNVAPPKGTRAWIVVDAVDFQSMNISNHSGELVLPVENSIKLQKALAKAKILGMKMQVPGSAERRLVANFELRDIPGAINWLDTCNLIGVGALPR